MRTTPNDESPKALRHPADRPATMDIAAAGQHAESRVLGTTNELAPAKATIIAGEVDVTGRALERRELDVDSLRRYPQGHTVKTYSGFNSPEQSIRKVQTDTKETKVNPRTPPIVYELFATTKDGRDLYDYELSTFAPASMDVQLQDGAACVHLRGPRRGALTTGARILRQYPAADVRIFEVPHEAHDAWMFATESDFIRSADGLTFVIPGDPGRSPI